MVEEKNPAAQDRVELSPHRNSIVKADKVKAFLNHLKKKNFFLVKNAKDVELIAGLPFAVATKKNAAFNFVVADAGTGKTLFIQKVLEYVFNKTENNYLVLYFDFESDPSVLKQRKFYTLLEERKDIFLFFMQDIEKIYDEYSEIHTNATMVNAVADFIRSVAMSYANKKIIVVVDSFEDLVSDVEKTKIIKDELKELFIPNITYIFNHHINKNELQGDKMRFAGSRVLKAKALSMLYLVTKEISDDGCFTFYFKILKTRFEYGDIKELTVKFTTENDMEIVDMIATGEKKVILGIAYSILKNERQMKQSELVEAIREKVNMKIGKHKIRNTLIEYENKFFDVKIGDKNARIYTFIQDTETIKKFYTMMGWNDISETKKELYNLIQIARIMNVDGEINVDGVIYANLSVLQKDVLSMSEARAEACVERLSIMLEDAENE